ncbi:MAG: small, acid-soluble spore protein, alpha/beta type [Bacillota bacterium]|uniref:small, acid-soluble spore protein, alpha/beta type n=1 Tax=Desulfurispora thermophila TaxID=265470 RepID=UPI00037229A4|nr:small, acid-soluble spore protein, alpha/beta type [Desulfurispora thermophila]
MTRKKKSAAELRKEALKWEIAAELGLADKIRSQGWGALNGVESGRIGGLLARRLRNN